MNGIKFDVDVDNPAGVSYQWTPSTGLSPSSSILEPMCYPTGPLTYTLTATNLSGCTESAEVFVQAMDTSTTSIADLTVVGVEMHGSYPSTVQNIFTSGTTIQPYATTTFYAAFDLTQSGITIEAGDIVYITTKAGCVSKWQFSFLGFSFEDLKENGKTFPNPFDDQFSVVFNSAEKCKALVTDLSGRIVLEREVEGGTFTAGENFPAGVYTLKIFSQEGTPVYLTKLIKE
ncbi:MAG: T9SS type A sorting domain-containing protein [Patescibacteria group bacterium]